MPDDFQGNAIGEAEQQNSPQGHDERMAQQYENGGDQDAGQLLAGKFTSAEELERAYKELESKLGSQATGGQENNSDSSQNASEDADDGDNDEGEDDNQSDENQRQQAKEAVENAGLDFSKYEQEFQQNGELSEDSLKELEQAGFDRARVQTYMRGVQARSQDLAQTAFNEVGGQETYQQMVQWAGQNLPQSEIDAFNRVMDGGDENQIRLAVRGLAQKYQEQTAEPDLVTGDNSAPTQTADVYGDWSEAMKDMSSQKYKDSPAFRTYVQNKLNRSRI